MEKERNSELGNLNFLPTCFAEEYLEQSVRETVTEVAFLLARTNTLDSLLWSVTKVMITKLGFSDCVIYTAEDDGEHLTQRAAAGPKSSNDYLVLNPIKLKIGQGIVGVAAESGEAVRVADTRLDSRYVVDDDIRLSELAVPIIDNGRILGVIDSEHSALGFYTPQHEEAIKNTASLLVHRITAVKEVERLRHKIRFLQRKLRSLEPDPVAQTQTTSVNDRLLKRFDPSIAADRCVVGRDIIFLKQKFQCRTQKMCALLGINMSTWSMIIQNENEPVANVSVALTVRLLDVYPALATDEASLATLIQALETDRGGKVKLQEIAVMLGKDRTSASAWRHGTQPSDAVISLYNHLLKLFQSDPTALDYYRKLVDWEARSRNVADIWKTGSWSKRQEFSQ